MDHGPLGTGVVGHGPLGTGVVIALRFVKLYFFEVIMKALVLFGGGLDSTVCLL